MLLVGHLPLQIDFPGQGPLQQRFKLLALFLIGKHAALGVCDEKRVENDSVRPSKDLGAEDVESGGGEASCNLAEEPHSIPGADLDGGIAAIGLVVPFDDRFERLVFLVELELHEPMGHVHIARDLLGRVNEEIAGRQVVEIAL